MPIQIIEQNPDELIFLQTGSKKRSLFFLLLGLVFQLLFVWAYWSFINATGPWAYIWLTLINMELFPFTAVLFLFGGGCFLLAIREAGWIEKIIIQKDLFPETPGIQKMQQVFKWNRGKLIPKNQINTLRIHQIPLDDLKLFNRFQIEIDYRVSIESPLEKLVLFIDDSDIANRLTLRLTQKIMEILKFSKEIERTEASPPIRKKK